jgi:hypothetical protein
VKPKPKLGDFIPLQWDDAPPVYYLRGHVVSGSPEELAGFKEIEAVEGYDPGALKGFVEPGRHTWARWECDGNSQYDHTLRERREGGRGCFAVTAYYVKKGV